MNKKKLNTEDNLFCRKSNHQSAFGISRHANICHRKKKSTGKYDIDLFKMEIWNRYFDNEWKCFQQSINDEQKMGSSSDEINGRNKNIMLIMCEMPHFVFHSVSVYVSQEQP